MDSAEIMAELATYPNPGDPLVSITEQAAVKAMEIRDTDEEIDGALPLRLLVSGGGCAGFSYELFFDAKLDDVDREYEFHGLPVVVDEMSLMFLVGVTVDYIEGLAGAGFKFENPNVKSTCGCGSSFGY